MLYALLNGGAPYLLRDAAYPGIDGAFEGAEMCDEERAARCRVVSDFYMHVAKKELIRHEFPGGDLRVQRSVFADGTAVTVNDDANAPAGSLCTIAPGSINGETGDHVFGTMTIGAEDFSRAVKFNTNGRLLCHIGENRASDKLMVYGTVKVTGEGNQIEVVVPEDLKRARTGKYTLLEARAVHCS